MSSPEPSPHDVLKACEEEIKEPLAEFYKRLARFSRLASGAVSEEQRGLLANIVRDVEAIHDRVAQLFAAERAKTHPPVLPEAVTSQLRALPGTPSVQKEGDRCTVLVVDDDTEARDLLQELLAPHYDVLMAPNALEALRLSRERHPHVVVTDLCMPDVDGFSLLSAIREDDETAHVPMVVVSGMTDVEAKVRAFESGAFDYLTKPVNAGEVIARVRNAIARAEELRHERMLQSTDDLTGLANRRYLRSFLQVAARNAARNRTELTVVVLDQDNLKQINDQYGHACGDAAIRVLAQALNGSKRASDCAARIGGDEFVVVMPGADREGAARFVARVEDELENHSLFPREGAQITVRASFGAASASDMDWTEACDDLLARADRVLYEAKRARKAAAARLKIMG